MEPTAAIATGLLLGLSSGGQCFWSCASVMGPFMVATSGDVPASGRRWTTVPAAARALLWYNLGRLLAYLAVGLLVSSLAHWGGRLPPALQAAAQLGTAALLAWSLLRPARAERCWAGRRRAGGALAIGLLQGVSPCPPFVTAIGLALAAPGLLGGLLLFLSLFVGTALFTLPLALLEPIRRRRWLTVTLHVVGWLVCAYLAGSALGLLIGG